MNEAVKENALTGLRKYKPYPVYKDSGVEWLGEVPAHWEITVLKHSFKVVNGSTPSITESSYWDGDIPWVTPNDLGGLKSPHISTTRRNITLAGYKSCGTNMVSAGSIVMSTRAPIGHIAIAEVDLCTNQGCRSLIPVKYRNSKFYYYLLYCKREKSKRMVKGVHLKLSRTKLGNLVIPTPMHREQNIISCFLDSKTAKIDALIAKQERLIELLQEKRAALITRAVTKGLDPDVPMKDSGIEWIGEIPEGWEVVKLAWVFNLISSGTTPPSSNPKYYDGNIPWINTGDLNDGYICDTPKKISKIALEDFSALKLHPIGTLLIAMYGATIGRVGIAKIVTTSNQACCALSKPTVADTKFIFYWFLAQRTNIISLAYGGGQPNISQTLIKSLRLPLPKQGEQKRIVDYLDQKTSRVNSLITGIQRSIELLEEYKQSLITAAVTGKIDVRPEVSSSCP